MATGQIFPNPINSGNSVLLNPSADQTITGAYALIFTGGGVIVAQGLAVNIETVTANYAAAQSDFTILVSGTMTVTLPDLSGRTGQTYRIKNIGSGIVTISSAYDIDNATSQTLNNQYDSMDVQWDGTQWWIMSQSSNLTQQVSYLQQQVDLLQVMIQEIRAMKTAVIALDNTALPQDFEGPSYSDLTTSEVSVG